MVIDELRGIPVSKYTEEMWNFIEEQYHNGVSLQGMANELGIPKSTFTMARFRWQRKPKKPKEKIARYKWTFNIDFNKDREWYVWQKDHKEYNSLLHKKLKRIFGRKRYIATFDSNRKKGTLDIMLLNGYDYSGELEKIPNIIVDTANELGIGVVLK